MLIDIKEVKSIDIKEVKSIDIKETEEKLIKRIFIVIKKIMGI